MKRQLAKFNLSKNDAIMSALEFDGNSMDHLRQLNSDIAVISTISKTKGYDTAIRYLAYALPKRECVWWAYLCAKETDGHESDVKIQQALRVVEQWTRQPSPELQSQAHALAQSLEFYCPTSWAAMAIYWSGDNIAPPGKPEVKPSEFMTGDAVANGVMLAAHVIGTQQRDPLKHYLKRGLHIAMGGSGKI